MSYFGLVILIMGTFGPRYHDCLFYKVGTYNPGQNIWNKHKNPVKLAKTKKLDIIFFPCFVTATAKV